MVDSQVNFFANQENIFFTEFSLTRSEFDIFPVKINLRRVVFDGLSGFTPSETFIRFLTANPIHTLLFRNFFDDEDAFVFQNTMKEFRGKITFQKLDLSSPPGVFFINTNIVIIISTPFLSKFIKFDSEEASISFSDNSRGTLALITDDAFEGQAEVLISLAIFDLNVGSLDLQGTEIKTLGDFDFSVFENLTKLNFQNSPLQPQICEDIEALIERNRFKRDVQFLGFSLVCIL
eukprot:snap_masked-scaffold_10-processed-gene-8.26-mRNA-1 protein AED:1.00 eAED:1.00 QI:0/0/0/0/1/1/2/0/233